MSSDFAGLVGGTCVGEDLKSSDVFAWASAALELRCTCSGARTINCVHAVGLVVHLKGVNSELLGRGVERLNNMESRAHSGTRTQPFGAMTDSRRRRRLARASVQ